MNKSIVSAYFVFRMPDHLVDIKTDQPQIHRHVAERPLTGKPKGAAKVRNLVDRSGVRLHKARERRLPGQVDGHASRLGRHG